MLSKINNVNQPLTWIELLETIFFLSRSRMTIPSLISSQKRQSRCHLLWQFWAILRFIGHFLCCPETVTKSNLNIQVLLKSSPWMGRVRSVVELYWCTNRDSWTTRDGPASVQSRSRLQTIFWHSVWKYPGMVEQNFTELIRQTTNHQHHQLLFKGWQNSWVRNGWCLYKVTQGNDPISWQAEVIVRLCKPVQLRGWIISNIPSVF